MKGENFFWTGVIILMFGAIIGVRDLIRYFFKSFNKKLIKQKTNEDHPR